MTDLLGVYMRAPETWPFKTSTVPSKLMPSHKTYAPNNQGVVFVDPHDISTLLGLGFYLYGQSPDVNALLAGLPGADDPSMFLAMDGIGRTPRSSPSSEDVTTGAVPSTADNTVKVTRITTGGTGGAELLYLPDFTTTDPDGYTHVIENGIVHAFVLDHQTDGNDEVHISPSSGGSPYDCKAIDAIGNQLVDVSAIILDQESARINFIWWDWKWFLIDATDGTSTNYTNKRFPVSVDAMNGLGALPAQSVSDLRSAYIWVKATDGEVYKASLDQLLACGFIASNDALDLRAAGGTSGAAGFNASVVGGNGNNTGAGGTALLRGGYSGAGDTGDGGSATLSGGDSFATDGNGGDAILQPGAGSGTGKAGHVIIDYSTVPTSDPHVAGALWRSGADMKISAG